MTTSQILESIASGKVLLTRSERIEHWGNLIFALIPFTIFGYITLYEPLVRGEWPISGIVVIGLFILFLRHKITSPHLDVYASNLTDEQFKQANQAAAKLNGWEIRSNRLDYFAAVKSVGWQRQGIKITAIHNQGKLYLNSMVNPSMRSNPFTLGLNRKHKMELIRQYQAVLKGDPVLSIARNEIKKREEKFWEEPEWTLKNILVRFTGYGLTLMFLAICILMIYERSWGGLFIGSICLGICSIYIRSDIKIIREKNQRKKRQL